MQTSPNSQQTLKTLSVAVPCPLPQTFNYLPYDGLNVTTLKAGMRVKVPFGRRELIGIFLKIEINANVETTKLKPIIEVLDPHPIFSDAMLSLLQWIHYYYHYPLGEVFSIAMPSLLRKGSNLVSLTKKTWSLTEPGKDYDDSKLKRAPKQMALLKFLKNHPELSEDKLSNSGFNREVIKNLIAKNIIEETTTEVLPEITKYPESPLELNEEQKQVVETIIHGVNAFNVFMLQGITGSGKTEVYFHVIAEKLKQNKQVLVLVPEIGLTPQTVNRFRRRFAVPIAVMHSDLTDKQRLDNWVLTTNNKVQIIIGTRSAIFSPLKNLGLIIIDEEHDQSFKQQETLRYSARDVAIVYAKNLNIPVILGSATPSLESFYNAKQAKYQFLTLSQRAGHASLPKVQLLDIRNKYLEDGLAPATLEKIKTHIANQGQVLLFLNRRGFSPSLICHQCGYVFQCDRCDAKYTYHQTKNKLICHHCDKQLYKPKNCPECQSTQLQPSGLGTERIEHALAAHFDSSKIVRVDRDSTRKKGSFNELLRKINDGEFTILIGTQMLAKGHHFPNVTLAVIINADGGLLSADLRASERMGQLITQVAGRSGRADRPGEVLIQTRQPDDELLQLLLKHDYQGFSETLLKQRELAQMPPFSFMALFRADAFSPTEAFGFLNELKSLIASKSLPILTLGPITAPLQKKAGKFRAQLLLQAKNRGQLQKLLNAVTQEIPSLQNCKKVKWSLDVDPIDLM